MHINEIGDVRNDRGRNDLEPIVALAYDLDVLLDQMTTDSFPEHLDFGAAVGSEVW